MKLITTIIAAALTTAASAQTPATAGQSVVVRYDDLNLGSARGQAMLDQRIVRAAKSVCGVNDGNHELAQTIESDHCFRTSMASAKLRLAAARAPVLAAR